MGIATDGVESGTMSAGMKALDAQEEKQMANQLIEMSHASKIDSESKIMNMKMNEQQNINSMKYG